MTERVAVVTGAAQGMGRQIVDVLRGDGWAVVGFDLLPTDGGVVGNVASATDVGKLVEHVRQQHGRVDVLVNNAGIAGIVPFEDTSLKLWQRIMEVNLTGPFLLSQAFGRMMLEQGSGSIVNIASVAGLSGVADRAAYNTSNHVFRLRLHDHGDTDTHTHTISRTHPQAGTCVGRKARRRQVLTCVAGPIWASHFGCKSRG
jgi:NAD(P)-dependent dehydrogenase (short-subunit alcohol dehydrogenase family)